jgi:hypothetical protein
VALERELALDKRLGQGRAVQAPDGSHLERGEVLVDRMKQAQLSYKMGISTDRLQLVAAPDSL